MRQVRDVIRLKSAGMPTREIARRVERRVDGAVDDPPVRGGGPELAVARRRHRHRAGGPAVRRLRSQPGHPAGPAPAGRAGLGFMCTANSAQARDAVDPVGGIHRERARRVSLLALLRALPGLGRSTVGDDAPVACGRRQAVRRLCGRRRAGGDRPAHRRAARRADLRRGARRIELHLRAGDLDAGGSPIGSAATSAPSRRSAACRRCWCRTIPRSR